MHVACRQTDDDELFTWSHDNLDTDEEHDFGAVEEDSSAALHGVSGSFSVGDLGDSAIEPREVTRDEVEKV